MRAELVIIGAGTAGLRTALTAAQNGTKTVLIGDGPLGGTCLNNGCIPTKTMLHAAELLSTIQRAEDFGIKAKGKANFANVMQRVRSFPKEGRAHARKAVKAVKNLTYLEGRAEFAAKNVVVVGQHRIVARKVIVATGTRPFIPPVPGLGDVPYMTNEQVVNLKKQPKHVIILGGGYIACEFATFFARMGSSVTIIERGPMLLGMLDDDLRKPLLKSFDRLGIRVYTNTVATNVTHNKKYSVTLAGADISRAQGDALIVATGRRPNSQSLKLERAGIKMDKRGFIVTDSTCKTSNKDVYAIGDINGQSLFAHTAKREGWLVLEHIVLEKHTRMDYEKIGWAVFTAPTIAGVGLLEKQLLDAKQPYEVLEAPFLKAGKARIIGESKGKVKVLHHKGKILGAFIVGPDADNLIHEFVALMHMGKMGVTTLKRMIHIHPTLAEVCESLKPRG